MIYVGEIVFWIYHQQQLKNRCNQQNKIFSFFCCKNSIQHHNHHHFSYADHESKKKIIIQLKYINRKSNIEKINFFFFSHHWSMNDQCIANNNKKLISKLFASIINCCSCRSLCVCDCRSRMINNDNNNRQQCYNQSVSQSINQSNECEKIFLKLKSGRWFSPFIHS